MVELGKGEAAESVSGIRPRVLTALVFLLTIFGVGYLYFSITFLGIGDIRLRGLLGSMLGFTGTMMGILLASSGILCLVLAYGWWRGDGWAWTLGLVFLAFGIIINLPFIMGSPSEQIGFLFSELINISIYYYLTRPHVREFFGK